MGSCASIRINGMYKVSLRNKNLSNSPTNFMATPAKNTDSKKYLDVTLQSNLKWDKHINNITPKASQTLGFLRRNLKVNSQKINDHAYKALVRPTPYATSFRRRFFAYHHSESSAYKYYLIMIVLSFVPKLCRKNSKNRFTNKHLTSKNVLDQ